MKPTNSTKKDISTILSLGILIGATPQAQAGVAIQGFGMNTLIILAQADNLATQFGFVLTILAVVLFILGTIWVAQGAMMIKRGEEGKMSIIGGLLTALALPIMRWIFGKVMPGSGVETLTPGQL